MTILSRIMAKAAKFLTIRLCVNMMCMSIVFYCVALCVCVWGGGGFSLHLAHIIMYCTKQILIHVR